MPSFWGPSGNGPPFCGQGGRFGEPGRPGLRPRLLVRPRRRNLESGALTIAGTTRDENGTQLAACTVHLFESTSDLEVAMTTSDASGNFSFTVQGAGPYYLVAHKSTPLERGGGSVRTILAS